MPEGTAVSAEDLARAIEVFLTENPQTALLENGQTLFMMERSSYALDLQHGRCILQVWSEERNIVRRITGMRARKQSLLLETQRMGQSKPGMIELAPATAQRAPSERKLDRGRYLRKLERALQRHFSDWKLGELHNAQDLEHSFGPAYVRGELRNGNRSMAVIAVGPEESPAAIDGILTLAVLWLARLRQVADARRIVEGVRMVLPSGTTAATAARIAWMDARQAKWELFELDETAEELVPVAANAGGNLATRLLQAPNEARVRERFATEIAQIMAMAPECEIRVLNPAEIAFTLHGLAFARAKVDADATTLARTNRLTFGAGVNETSLTQATASQLRAFVEQLRQSRQAGGSAADPLYRMAPEAWLESQIRRDVAAIDRNLQPAPVYTQMSAFSGTSDRGMLDLFARTRDGRLAVLELKANEDMHLALQGLDYWMLVRRLHLGTAESEFTRRGYFGKQLLDREEPALYLVAPALRIHSATEVVLGYFSPRVPWTLVAMDERWRSQVKVVWRKRNTKDSKDSA